MNPIIKPIATEADVNHIIGLLSHIYPVSDKLAAEFKSNALQFNLQKGEHILLQGGICKHMYFIKSGAMMGYVPNGNKNITTYISIENEFVSSLSGLYGNEPSKEAIVAIEDTVLIGVDTDVLLGWYEKFFDLNYIIRKVYENYYRDSQERSYVMRAGNAKERYVYLLRSRAGDINRLPTDCVASFLSMKPATLIKVKKEIENDQLLKKESAAIVKKLEAYVLDLQSFKDKNLSLKTLSTVLNIPQAKIAYALKAHFATNCKDYVNKHRIYFFKSSLIEKANIKNLTLTALALEAGFASKSSFYLAFKKLEGQSPKTFLP